MNSVLLALLVAFIGGFFTILAAIIAVLLPRYLERRQRKTPSPSFPADGVNGWTKSVQKTANWVTIVSGLLTIASFVIAGYLKVTENGEIEPFPIDRYFFASGLMGDIGDVQIGGTTFTYEAMGRGGGPKQDQHEWEFKYDQDGNLNTSPAKFAGVMWMCPQNNWGTVPNGGYDLRGYNKICWEARSLTGPVNVEFLIGGIDWIWGKDKNGKTDMITPPFPDSMKKRGLGIKPLTEQWQLFEESLSKTDGGAFKRVIGGFGWVISWGNNDVKPNAAGTGPEQSKTFKFEVKNIQYRYEKEEKQ